MISMFFWWNCRDDDCNSKKRNCVRLHVSRIIYLFSTAGTEKSRCYKCMTHGTIWIVYDDFILKQLIFRWPKKHLPNTSLVSYFSSTLSFRQIYVFTNATADFVSQEGRRQVLVGEELLGWRLGWKWQLGWTAIFRPKDALPSPIGNLTAGTGDLFFHVRNMFFFFGVQPWKSKHDFSKFDCNFVYVSSDWIIIWGGWCRTFFIVTPIWRRFAFWLIFFKGVETTK